MSPPLFLENEQCEMLEFLFYSVFGPLFFFSFFLPLSGQFFSIFFLATKKKRKVKNWARGVGLCGKSETVYLRLV